MYKFEFNNKNHSIPLFQDLSMGVLRKARKAENDLDKTFIIIEELLGEDSDAIKALDKMNPTQFQQFLEGWTQGAPLGESLES